MGRAMAKSSKGKAPKESWFFGWGTQPLAAKFAAISLDLPND
jgi:hypothetical protein